VSDTNLFLDFWAKSIKFDSESGGWWVVVGCFFVSFAKRQAVARSLARSLIRTHRSLCVAFLLFFLFFCCFFVAFL